MPWVRFDDGFPEHPKVLELKPAAAWLHVAAICYSNRHLTDGFVPQNVDKRLTKSTRTASLTAQLVEHGLWTEVEGGWQIHDYLEYQPTREKVLQERDAAAERQRLARERRKAGVTDMSQRDKGVTSPLVTDMSQRPNPTQPKGKTPLPQAEPGARSEHDGQHKNCRACGTNPRALGTNPRGPDPVTRHLKAIEGELERNAQRLRGEACEKCDGSGWVDVETDHGPSVARCTACEDSARDRVRQAMENR